MKEKIKSKLSSLRRRDLALFVGSLSLIVGLVAGYLIANVILTGVLNLPFFSIKLFEAPKYGVQISTANISNKVEQYLTKNFLEPYNATARISNFTNLGNLIVFQVDVVEKDKVVSGGEVYATPDGEIILFGQAYNMSIPLQPPQLKQKETEIPKKDKPEVKLFVMSFCPYGQQAENSMWPVVELLKDKIAFELHFVVYPSDYYKGAEQQYCIDKYCSMHGIGEINEDVRQLCIIKNYNSTTWLNYISEINKRCNYKDVDECWEKVAGNVSIDVNLVKKCFEEEKLDLLENEMKLNEQFGVQGSPTLFINNVEYSGSRTPEAYKSTICNAFSASPEECSVTLSGEGGTVSGSCG